MVGGNKRTGQISGSNFIGFGKRVRFGTGAQQCNIPSQRCTKGNREGGTASSCSIVLADRSKCSTSTRIRIGFCFQDALRRLFFGHRVFLREEGSFLQRHAPAPALLRVILISCGGHGFNDLWDWPLAAGLLPGDVPGFVTCVLQPGAKGVKEGVSRLRHPVPEPNTPLLVSALEALQRTKRAKRGGWMDALGGGAGRTGRAKRSWRLSRTSSRAAWR